MVAQLKDMEITGVHLVGSPAVKKSYLIVKSEGGNMAKSKTKDEEKDPNEQEPDDDEDDVSKASGEANKEKRSMGGSKKPQAATNDNDADDPDGDGVGVNKSSGSGAKVSKNDDELIKSVMAILKSVDSDGAKAALASLEGQFGEKASDKADVANVIKSMVPDIAKQIEEPLRKSLDEQKKELEEIRKSNALLIGEKVEREIEEISKSIVGDSDENKKFLRLMKSKVSAEEFEEIVKREKARSEQVRKSTFRELGGPGSSNAEYASDTGTGAYKELTDLANSFIQKSSEKITFDKAMEKAVAERPDLWDSYRNSTGRAGWEE